MIPLGNLIENDWKPDVISRKLDNTNCKPVDEVVELET